MSRYYWDNINHELVPISGYGDGIVADSIAPTEQQVSENAYTVGKRLFYKDVLYVVTKSIAVGDTLDPTPSTGNITPSDTISDLLENVKPADNNFKGTWEEWEELTQAERDEYDTLDIEDDFNTVSIEQKPTQNSQNLVYSGGIHSFVVGTLLTQTLEAGETEVTFTGIPTTGDHIITFYTSIGINYIEIDTSTSGQITLTFEEQDTDVSVYCRINEV